MESTTFQIMTITVASETSFEFSIVYNIKSKPLIQSDYLNNK